MQKKKTTTTQSPKNLIGKRMRLMRRNAQPRVTQLDLSARVAAYGVELNQASISKIENGTRIVTDLELKAIASSLAISIGWLVDEDETFVGVKGPSVSRSKRMSTD